MRFSILTIIFLLLLGTGCNTAPTQFVSWQQQMFDQTPITGSQTKIISLRNESPTENQKLLGVGFDGSAKGDGNFQIDKVSVGDRVVGLKDIIVPPQSSLNIQITYRPRNLETTQADFGGWVTGEKPRFVPYKPGEEPVEPDTSLAIHRAVFLAVYDIPKAGITQIEFVGNAVVGPQGEISLPEAGSGPCEAGGGVGCFTGDFLIDIPKFFSKGGQALPLSGPIRFGIADGKASLRMEDLPPILFPLKGNGPGEPLEGQPVSAVTIIIKGMSGSEATGTFDGSRIELQNVGVRVQVVVGELDPKDIVNISPLVDFNVDKLMMITEEPFTDGNITLKIDTTLSQNPSGNPLFDEFLGNAEIIVRFKGRLSL